MLITPSILAKNEQECREKLFHPGLHRKNLRFHIDILDGTLFNATSWADPEMIGSWPDLPEIEIHIMSENPFLHVVAWHKYVASLRRVILHQEIARPLGTILEQVEILKLDRTVALNPETPIEHLEKYQKHIDEVLLMSVHPGASGQAFLGEPILAKIRRTRVLFPNLDIALDGGVTRDNIGSLAETGANRCVCGAALWQHPHPEDAHDDLLDAAKVVL